MCVYVAYQVGLPGEWSPHRVLMLLLQHPNTFSDDARDSKPYVSKGVAGVKWAGFGTAFTFSAVALNVHYNMPDVIQV